MSAREGHAVSARKRTGRLLYAYRVFAKWLSFVIFGIGTVLIVSLCFPPMRLFLHPRLRFKKYARILVSLCFRFFVAIMTLLMIVELDAGDRTRYRTLSGKIIAANHPSLLDVVMLISLIPNADCIVRSGLSKTIVRGVIRQLYIPNSGNFEKLLDDCSESLREGNCIIIFPEGTRTPAPAEIRTPAETGPGKNVYKKGAVRISLKSGRGIVPVHIGGTDKYGLRKHDPWTGFNPNDKYIYRLTMREELSPEKYRDEPGVLAVKHFNAELYKVLTK
jgi:1-acyl-sn-glycerol-3-phosphate acyltransferase